MKPAADVMSEKIRSTNFNKPDLDIICNVTAKSENNPDKIKKLLVDQIYSSVKWRESLIYMFNEGVSNFIEIGPGKVLSGMAKRTIKNSRCFSINSITDIKEINDRFKNKKF